jgi:hypothetical protein
MITAEDIWVKFVNHEKVAVRFTTIDEVVYLMERLIELGMNKSINLFSESHLDYHRKNIKTHGSMMIINNSHHGQTPSIVFNCNSIMRYKEPYLVYTLSYDNGFGVDL